MTFPQDKELRLKPGEYLHITRVADAIDETGLVGALEDLTKRERAFLAAKSIEKMFLELYVEDHCNKLAEDGE